jgi:hypothetical protein
MKIGLIPVSGKPYHSGHHALVTRAAAENDRVILFVSTSDRKRKGQFPISGADMQQIWDEELEPIMPGNVEIQYGGSPVRKVYDTIGQACSIDGAEETFVVYSDPTDTAQNYPQKQRDKYMQPLCDQGQVIFAAEENPEAFTRGVGTPDVSGTAMRAALESGDLEFFASNMPAGVNAENVYNILRKDVNENVLRKYIQAMLPKI